MASGGMPASILLIEAENGATRTINGSLRSFILLACVRNSIMPEKDHTRKENLLQAQNALEKSEKILRNLYNNFPVGIELYDKNGILIDMNDKDVMMFGGQKKKIFWGSTSSTILSFCPKSKKNAQKRTRKLHLQFRLFDVTGVLQKLKESAIRTDNKISYLYNKQGELTNYMFINIDNLDTINAYKKIQEFEAYLL